MLREADFPQAANDVVAGGEAKSQSHMRSHFVGAQFNGAGEGLLRVIEIVRFVEFLRELQLDLPRIVVQAGIERHNSASLLQGFEGTSIDQIAEAAGVSRQTIYNNFESKEALFKAIAGALADHVVEPLLNEDLQTGDVESTLIALAGRSLALMVLQTLRTMGITAEADAAGNLLARISGRAERAILLCAHLDTVPVHASIDCVTCHY